MHTIKVSHQGVIIICFIMFFTNIKCNIWDNMITQLSSPQFSIPDELKLEVFNQDNKAMEIFISSKLNMIKFSLINDDLVRSVIPNNITSTVADIYLNFTNGTIKIDFEDSCYFKNVTAISKLTTKFILFSYDLLTYFKDTQDYYEYILTNPLQQPVDHNAKMNFYLNSNNSDKENNRDDKITPINQIESLNDMIIGSNNIFDKESMIVFKVNKLNKSLEKISLKYKHVDLTDLDVKVFKVDSFDEDVFKINHECKLLEVNDIDGVKDVVNERSKNVNENKKFLTFIE